VDARAAAADTEQLWERIPTIAEVAALMPAGTLGEGHLGPTDPQWVADRVAGAERLLTGRLAGSETT
jgi:hypothetical protein